jgi:hypothetical protein
LRWQRALRWKERCHEVELSTDSLALPRSANASRQMLGNHSA